MTPEQYKQVQSVFLEIRESDSATRNQKLEALHQDSSTIANEVRKLLASAAQDDDSFLEQPLVQRSANAEFETRDLRGEQVEELPHPAQIGPYRILQKIGEGGHGVVFMAEQSKPIRRRVAIKWVKPGMDSKMILARFEAERQALAMMNHPSIANVIDANTTEAGQPYFVMELVHGVPIDQFCDENEMELGGRLLLFQQICSAVHHAHRKGIIHRDIKPANVLVTVESGAPLVKVIDFGIAKALHMPLTEKTMFTEYGQIIGTLEYMSPEQALMSQSGIDVRSDVYSLGVLLYLMITGETPLSKRELLEKGIWELKNVLQNTRPENPSVRITSQQRSQGWRDHAKSKSAWLNLVKGDLDWVTMKALAKEPEKRYDSAAELGEDIAAYLDGDSVNARPPTTWYRFSKFVKRNRVAVGMIGVLAIAMLFSIGALTWGYFQSQKNLQAVTHANQRVNEKAEALEREKERADENANRMAKMLERSILETAWTHAMDGDLSATRAALSDIPPTERRFGSQFVESVGKQMRLPVLRSENAGTIRKLTVQASLGLVAAITTKSVLEIWSSAELKQVASIQLPTQIYSTLAFGESGASVLVGAPGDSVLLVDLGKEKILKTRILGKGGIRDIVHDATHRRWYVTTGANHICALDGKTLEDIASQKLGQRISKTSIDPESRYVVVSSLDGTLNIFNSEDLELAGTIQGLPNEVASFRWVDNQLLAGDWSGALSAVEWSRSGQDQQDSRLPFSDPTTIKQLPPRPVSLNVTQNGSVFGAWRDGRVAMFDRERDQVLPIRTFASPIRFVCFLDNSRQLLVAHATGRINLIGQKEIQRGRAFAEAMNDLADGLSLIDSNVAVSGHLDGSLKTWNASSGALLYQSKSHQAEVFELDGHEKTELVASLGADRKIVVSNLAGLHPVHKFACDWGVRCLAFSPDGSLLAGAPDIANPTDRREGTVDLWDLKSGTATRRLSGHTNWVTEIRFSEDGNQIVTLSVDGTARVWAVADGRCLHTIELTSVALARSMAISSSNKLFIGHDDGTITAWDLRSGKQIHLNQVSADSIIGLCAPIGSDCLIATAQSNSKLLLLDSNSLKTVASFEAGVGNILSMRSGEASRQLQIMGDSGLLRVWRFH